MNSTFAIAVFLFFLLTGCCRRWWWCGTRLGWAPCGILASGSGQHSRWFPQDLLIPLRSADLVREGEEEKVREQEEQTLGIRFHGLTGSHSRLKTHQNCSAECLLTHLWRWWSACARGATSPSAGAGFATCSQPSERLSGCRHGAAWGGGGHHGVSPHPGGLASGSW